MILSNSLSKTEEWIKVFSASLFLALFAQICIPLPWSPIPITGQTFGVRLAGATLGSSGALLAVLFYLAEGAIGLPFFSGGRGGLFHLVGPGLGYFLGFAVQAYLVGWFFERQMARRLWQSLAIMLFAGAIQLFLGACWLSFYTGLPLALGILPYIPGEIIKSALAALVIHKKWHSPFLSR